MMSFQKVIEIETSTGGITEHQIKLVPVEALHQQTEVNVGDEHDSQNPLSTQVGPEVIQVQVYDVVLPETYIVESVPHQPQPDDTPKQVNCLFCYKPVAKFDIKKPYARRILNNTCQRLFKHICDHLDIECPRVPNRGLEKPPKSAQLLPAYLPLCTRCRDLYYNNIYESFVTYEAAVIKLQEQIAACITRSIGMSAKENRDSVECDGELRPDDGANLFDDYQQLFNEHEVMRAVKQFRQKVVEKNPAGYIDETDRNASRNRHKGRQQVTKEEPAAITTYAGDGSAGPSGESGGGDGDGELIVPAEPDLTNVIKIVKNRSDILQRDRKSAMSTRLDIVKQEMDEDVAGIKIESDPLSDPDLNYYAVSNPAPGVIQIIPVVVGEDGDEFSSLSDSKRKKKQRSQREDYQKQRIALNTCKFCNKYFNGPSLLTRHQVMKHGMEKPEKCPQCDFRGIDKAAIKSHLSTHLKGDDRELAKKFACHICGLRFKGKSGLAGHLRSHSGEKPFVCEVCGKAFTSNTSRQLCLDKHNGVKHHKCAYCDKTFLRREVLKIHERTHTGEKPFTCHLCGKAFAQRSPLNIHLKMHKKKDPSCDIKKKA